MPDLPDFENGVGLTGGQSYTTTFTFSRSDIDTLELSFTMNDITLATSSSTDATFTFDTIAFYRSSNAATNPDYKIYLDNVEVSYDSIPEPGQASMIFGAIAAAVIMIRRRRR